MSEFLGQFMPIFFVVDLVHLVGCQDILSNLRCTLCLTNVLCVQVRGSQYPTREVTVYYVCALQRNSQKWTENLSK